MPGNPPPNPQGPPSYDEGIGNVGALVTHAMRTAVAFQILNDEEPRKLLLPNPDPPVTPELVMDTINDVANQLAADLEIDNLGGDRLGDDRLVVALILLQDGAYRAFGILDATLSGNQPPPDGTYAALLAMDEMEDHAKLINGLFGDDPAEFKKAFRAYLYWELDNPQGLVRPVLDRFEDPEKELEKITDGSRDPAYNNLRVLVTATEQAVLSEIQFDDDSDYGNDLRHEVTVVLGDAATLLKHKLKLDPNSEAAEIIEEAAEGLAAPLHRALNRSFSGLSFDDPPDARAKLSATRDFAGDTFTAQRTELHPHYAGILDGLMATPHDESLGRELNDLYVNNRRGARWKAIEVEVPDTSLGRSGP